MEALSVGLILQQVLNDALDEECSDVHIFTVGEELVVQFRRGGLLTQVLHAPQQGPTLIRKIKALARMDVAESRIPQDGAFHWVSESHESAVRVACLPTVDGEAMVLRLFPKRRTQLDLCGLGLTSSQARTVTSLLHKEAGLLLVAGPTSSGKTTTLYTMMEQLVRLGRRVVSIEDPVEQVVANCHQMQVKEHIGVTFDVGLRAALRQDPDVIMVGEIRDTATAQTALRASLTGHLVLTTTHAKDLVGAVARLVDLGLDRGLVTEAITAVIVQHIELRKPAIDAAAGVNANGLGQRQEEQSEKVATFHVHEMTSALGSVLASDLSWPAVRQQLYRWEKVQHHGVS
ncbi:Flp pilus assembly complex ATPase component TadA [Alicyclobacillus curvatus]|nr:Flp pilus assembly complex ATPase component TadA [Alicyclobacillus curvatus]